MATAPITFRDRLYQTLHIVPGGSLLFVLFPLVVFGYLGWYHYAADKIDRKFFSLKLDQIEISTQPKWITKSSVLEEVYKDKKLERINFLDPSSNADIASAFETHPWVKSTTRVRKYSNSMFTVDLIYRQPVAMIKVPCQDPKTLRWTEGFYPLDASAFVLPVEDFKEQPVDDYLLLDIENIDRTQVGVAYADARVHQALKLTVYLEASGLRKELGLQWLNVRRDDDVSSGRPWLIQLATSDNRQIIWGHAPGEEIGGEESPDRKLTRLVNWLKSERESGAQGGLLDLIHNKVGAAQTVSTP